MEKKSNAGTREMLASCLNKRKLQTPNSIFHQKVGKFVDFNQQSQTPLIEGGILPNTIDLGNQHCNNDGCYRGAFKDQLKDSLQKSFVARTFFKKSLSDNCHVPDTSTNQWSFMQKAKFYKNVDCLEEMRHISCSSSPGHAISISSTKLVKYKPMQSLMPSATLDWINPVIGSTSQDIASVSSTKVLSKTDFDKIYSSFRFSKEMLMNAEVIGQVDNKFIACRFLHYKEDVLVLIDQHAAHERIRLEKLLDQIGYYDCDNEKAKNSLRNNICNLSPPVEIFFTDNEIDLLLHYQSDFVDIGFSFSMNKTKRGKVTAGALYRLIVSTVPSIFVNVCQPQMKAKGSSVNLNLLKEYLVEQSRSLRVSSAKCQTVSPVIFKVLASYACHGAIRFGDPLQKTVCQKLVKDLSKCLLPFQCAHGRPSVAPLLHLSMITKFLKSKDSKDKPNLKRIQPVHQ